MTGRANRFCLLRAAARTCRLALAACMLLATFVPSGAQAPNSFRAFLESLWTDAQLLGVTRRSLWCTLITDFCVLITVCRSREA